MTGHPLFDPAARAGGPPPLPDPRARRPPPERGVVDEVLDAHVRRLRRYAEESAGDARFVSGVAWGLWALERAARAVRGITDPTALGLTDEPRYRHQLPHPPPEVPAVRTIHRYQLPVAEHPELDLPVGSTVLHIAPSRSPLDRIDLWAIVDADPAAPVDRYRFAVVGTGHPLPKGVDQRDHLGTVSSHSGRGVWHVFLLDITTGPRPGPGGPR